MSSFRQRVLDGEVLVGTFLLIDSPGSAEICARTGLDWVLIDLEHGLASESDLVAMLMAANGTGATALVRVESGTRIRVGRALDLGAAGIMVPQVHTTDDAASVARWIRAQPGGERGVALFTRGMGLGARGHTDVATRHEELLGIVQIESIAALGEAEEMARLDGVDVLFVGPTDLSHALGIPGRIDDPRFEAALRAVASAARAAGKAAGVMLWHPDDARRYIELGYTFLCISSDGSLLDRAIRGALGTIRTIASETSPLGGLERVGALSS
jgi:2-dehydro-3-deoxyglucarate aldolase/4-hydroxy-2-oxoheptanedioate aldolase